MLEYESSEFNALLIVVFMAGEQDVQTEIS
jgi:hypothetical protein